jgi:hypothetical protein
MKYEASKQLIALCKTHQKENPLLLPILKDLTLNVEKCCLLFPKEHTSTVLQSLLESTVNNEAFNKSLQNYSKDAAQALLNLKNLCTKDKNYIIEIISHSSAYTSLNSSLNLEEFLDKVSKITFCHIFNVMSAAYKDTPTYIKAHSLFDDKNSGVNLSDQKENNQSLAVSKRKGT